MKHTDHLNARDWMLGYASAFVTACKAGVDMRLLFASGFASGQVRTESAADGTMPVIPCPPGATTACCDQMYNDFAPLWDACTDQTCRDQVFAAYRASLTTCVDTD